MHVLRQDCT